MSNLPGNPHVYAGPQIAKPDWINESFIAEQGETVETVFLSELARNTEATLALAYEQRLATLATLFNIPDNSAIPGVDYAEAARQLSDGLGMRAEK